MNFKSLALAAAMTGAAALSATAATVTFDSTQQLGAVGTPPQSNGVAKVSFSWSETPSTVYTTFTSTSAFELSLINYHDSLNTDRGLMTSGYYLRGADGSNHTTQTNNCAAAAGLGAGTCNHIVSADYTGSIPGLAPGGVVGRFAAGTYLLGVYDSADPYTATASFQIAAVPLPATGLALIAGLGGLAALGARRRRKAA